MISNYRPSNLIAAIFLLLLFSCSSPAEKPVTAQEAKDFARELQSSIQKRNADFLDQAIDKKKMMKRAGLNKESDAKAFGSGFSERMNMGTQLIASLSEKGTYELVKQYEKNKKQYLLFRLYDNGTLNYHDIELVKTGKETKIVDMFIYTSGELFSETLHSIYTQLKSSFGEEDLDDKWISQMPKMRKLMNENKHAEAMDIYEHLPEKLKKMRALQIMHIMLASGLDDDAKYQDAIDEYTRLYPNEPNMHLLLIDNYVMKKQYDKALYSVNEMDKMINKDPFLDYYRGLLYKLMEKKDSSKASVVQLMNNMPDFEDGMLELIAVYLDEDNKEEADKWIKKYRRHSSFDQQTLTSVLMLSGYDESEK